MGNVTAKAGFLGIDQKLGVGLARVLVGLRAAGDARSDDLKFCEGSILTWSPERVYSGALLVELRLARSLQANNTVSTSNQSEERCYTYRWL